MRQGETFFRSWLERVDDEGFAQPCGLPDWTRADVVAHMARNADALMNLLTWARTGDEKPMYPSAAARAAGIAESAQQSPAALRLDVIDASNRLVDAVATLPDAAWEAEVRTARGRAITAAEVPWMRIRESWVHAVDLRTRGRGVIRNRVVQLYFWSMGFSTLRHVGTADHLHVQLDTRP